MPQLRSCRIYVAGEALKNNCSGWGAVLVDDDGAVTELAAQEPVVSSIGMELFATVAALESLREPSRATIYVTSDHVRNAFRRGSDPYDTLSQYREDFPLSDLQRVGPTTPASLLAIMLFHARE